MLSIIFIAPPAAGKGTQSNLLATKYHMPHIATGDLLREAASQDNERGHLIADQISKGILVSDTTILELLKERLAVADCHKGYILDGYPRDVEQAKSLDTVLKNEGRIIIIYLKLDKENARKRIVGRLSCPNCGAIYNSMNPMMKPKIEGFCDKCHSLLSQRADDTNEVFESRWDTYLKMTEPLINYYQHHDDYYEVDSNRDYHQVFDDICRIIEKK